MKGHIPSCLNYLQNAQIQSTVLAKGQINHNLTLERLLEQTSINDHFKIIEFQFDVEV